MTIAPADITDLFKKVLEKQCADETTTVGKVFAEHARAEVNKTLGDNSGKPLNVSFQLTAEQQNLLKRNFPGRVIKFSNSSSSSHSFAAAHRLLETDFIYGCFGSTGETILDLGGNYVSHLKQQRYNVHCCCPLLDVRDGARHTERLMSYTTFRETHPEEFHEVNFCTSLFQDCELKAEYAMAIHATSDLPLDVLCKALKKKGVKKFICTMMVAPEMLVHDKGHIENFNVDWEIDRESDRIYFDFVDAPCLGYDHKFSILKQYLQYNAVSLGDCAYRVERKMDFSGVIVIDITYCAGFSPSVALNAGRSCAWYNSVKGKTIVNVVDCTQTSHPMFDVTVKRRVLVDTKVLTRVCEAAFRQFKPNVDAPTAVQNISTMLSSSTNHCVINGVTMIAGTPLRLEDYVPVATTIYYRVRKIYEAIQMSLKNLTTEIDVPSRVKSTQAVGPLELLQHVVGTATRYEHTVNEKERLLSDSLFYAVRAVSKTLGFIPTKVETVRGKEDGQETRYECYESFSKNLKFLKSFVLGYYEVDSMLLQDPEFFSPLIGVLAVTCPDQGSALTVDDVKSHLDSRRAERMKAVEVEKEKQRVHRQKLEMAMMQIANWTKAHPDGKLPVGLGDITLVTDFVKSQLGERDTPVPDTESGPIINPYAESILEAIEYFKSTIAIQKANLVNLGEHCKWKKSGFSTMWAGDDSRRVYLPNENRWMGPTHLKINRNDEKYERGMTCDGYVSMTWDSSGAVSVDCRRSLMQYEIVIFDKSCVFSSSERLIPSLEKALRMNADFKVTIMDGVAGCGKTTQIVNKAKMDADDPDLVLSSNRNSAIELRQAINASELLKSRYVRTIDSFLMVNNPPQSKRLLMDECFLQHAGCIYAAATLCGCNEVIAYGDTEQIPFISRNDTFLLKQHKLEGSIVKQQLTYRSPADAAMALSKFFYKKKTPVKTKRGVLRSIHVKEINSVTQIRAENATVTCHTIAEKQILKSLPQLKNVEILTTHEAQGLSKDNIVHCRLSRTSNHLYSGKHPIMGPCHALVALSRHKTNFTYYTIAITDSDDILLKACQYALRSSDEEVSTHFAVDV